jgi:hypothetical protein
MFPPPPPFQAVAFFKTLSRLRPDLLLIHGLPAATAPLHDAVLSPAALSRLQSSCVVHILELGYTHDSCYSDTLSAKRTQHAELITLLVAAGWTLFSPPDAPPVPHVCLLGSFGTVFSIISPALSALGVPAVATPRLLRALHVHAVRFSFSIICARRRLERSSAFHPSLPHVHFLPP